MPQTCRKQFVRSMLVWHTSREQAVAMFSPLSAGDARTHADTQTQTRVKNYKMIWQWAAVTGTQLVALRSNVPPPHLTKVADNPSFATCTI